MPRSTPKTAAAPWVPDHGGLSALQRASQDCRGCDLWRHATRAVFGEGPAHPDLVLVGERPGDKEDLAGHPFIGPAGRVLDEALGAAGIDRGRAYLTNTVKHFKWERGSGQWRIHAKPNQVEIQACRPWHVLATVHPSSILRAPDEAARAEAMEAFIRDLRPVSDLLASAETRSASPGP